MHWHGEVASELFGKRIARGVAFADNRPNTEAGAEGLDARELPRIVELREPIDRNNRFRLGTDLTCQL
jgi:hypothetical protein